jgi:hypothetical protein
MDGRRAGMGLNWDAIGAVGEILGASAVVITLIYLAKELNHTKSSSQLSASDRLIAGFDQINRLVVTDSSVREVLVSEGELSAADSEQLYTFAVLYCNMWFSAQNAYDNGQIPDDLYIGAAKDVTVELERFPNLREPIELWLQRYPEVSDSPILAPLRESK